MTEWSDEIYREIDDRGDETDIENASGNEDWRGTGYKVTELREHTDTYGYAIAWNGVTGYRVVETGDETDRETVRGMMKIGERNIVYKVTEHISRGKN